MWAISVTVRGKYRAVQSQCGASPSYTEAEAPDHELCHLCAALWQRGSLTLYQVSDPVGSSIADGAYNQGGVYREVAARSPKASVVVPPRSNAVSSDVAQTSPITRDRHLQVIAEHGRTA